MRIESHRLTLIGLLTIIIALPVAALESMNGVARWEFDVYLDDKKVGKHQFEVSEKGDVKHVKSEASFNYKFLFISAYRYEHSAAERWTNDCLMEFDATTNANGKRVQVSGAQTGAGFSVERDDVPLELPECVMTFAYWNPVFLTQPRLLNPQTGEYMDVSVEQIGEEFLKVRGLRVAATRYKLTAKNVDLTLWYSPEEEWLVLESVAKGGRIIRYELS
jgi:hypothetical protein